MTFCRKKLCFYGVNISLSLNFSFNFLLSVKKIVFSDEEISFDFLILLYNFGSKRNNYTFRSMIKNSSWVSISDSVFGFAAYFLFPCYLHHLFLLHRQLLCHLEFLFLTLSKTNTYTSFSTFLPIKLYLHS